MEVNQNGIFKYLVIFIEILLLFLTIVDKAFKYFIHFIFSWE